MIIITVAGMLMFLQIFLFSVSKIKGEVTDFY